MNEANNKIWAKPTTQNSQWQSHWRAECPAAVGPCVYKARSIFATLVPGIQYYDDLACAAMLPSNKNGENPYNAESNDLEGMTQPLDSTNIQLLPNDIIIYPNPLARNQNITIAYNLPCDSKIDCNIIDIIGKKIQAIDLECGKRIVSTPVNDISTGIYTIVISQNGKKILNQKLYVK